MEGLLRLPRVHAKTSGCSESYEGSDGLGGPSGMALGLAVGGGGEGAVPTRGGSFLLASATDCFFDGSVMERHSDDC